MNKQTKLEEIMENENYPERINALKFFLKGYVAANENKIPEDPENEQLYRAVDFVLGKVQNQYNENPLEYAQIEEIRKENLGVEDLPEVKNYPKEMEDYNEFDNSTADYLDDVCKKIAEEKNQALKDVFFYKNAILFYQHLKNIGMNVYEEILDPLEKSFPAAQEEILDLDSEDIELIEDNE